MCHFLYPEFLSGHSVLHVATACRHILLCKTYGQHLEMFRNDLEILTEAIFLLLVQIYSSLGRKNTLILTTFHFLSSRSKLLCEFTLLL